MKRRNGDDETPVGTEEASEAGAEPTGLEPVPLPPPTREEHEALRRERDELKDSYLRKAADFDNYRKRAERERQQASAEAAAALMRDLVPTLDNLERALAAEGSESSLREGVELTRRELLALLAARGVTVEDPLGQLFDPSRHQAFSQESAPGVPEGTVLEVLRKGYRLGDRLLRPAMVKVARGGDAGGAGERDKVH
ncbi:MAG TPA: nucleotide exchange factor GrpE [Vicinamibacteria bacterium]|jgi:molecular chaperone GrpE